MADSEMVERVALMLTRSKVGFSDTTVPVDAARAVARSVIAAMREPTEAMFMAGGNVEPYNRAQTGRKRGGRIGDKPARDCWRTMIDRALADY